MNIQKILIKIFVKNLKEIWNNLMYRIPCINGDIDFEQCGRKIQLKNKVILTMYNTSITYTQCTADSEQFPNLNVLSKNN